MKKLALVAIVCSLVGTLRAEDSDPFTDGTLIVKPGKGAITLFSCQTKLGTNEVVGITKPFYTSIFIPVNVVTVKDAFAFDAVPRLMASTDGKVSVFLVDDKTLPPSLVAPESKWGLVNVAAAAQGASGDAVVKARLEKLFTRVAGQLVGVLAPRSRKGVMSWVNTVDGLDALTSAQLTFDLLANATPRMSFIGITPGRRASYKRACEEGWAPPPSNDLQREIADMVKKEMTKEPTDPIKIKFDPKKGK